MKKIITILLTLTVALILTACDDNSKEPSNDIQKNDSTSQSESQTKKPYNGELTAEILETYPETPASDFTYSPSTVYEGWMIESYNGDDDIVVIPKQIDGYDVVQVSSLLFGNDSTVKGVKIPDTVVRLNAVFANNDDIEVIIAKGVEEIGTFTFGNCFSLRELILDDSLRYFDEYAFSGCKVLEKLYISPSVQGLTKNEYTSAFHASDNLTIHGKSGSFIEGVAQELGIPFVAE